MLAIDGLTETYNKLAADAKPKEKEAYLLIVAAEKHLDKEEDEEGLKVALKAIDSLKALGKTLGVADATRLAVHVKIFQEQRKEAAQMAKSLLADCGSDKRCQARMLLSLAECNCDRRGHEKRELAIEQAMEAQQIFQAEDEKRLEANALITLCAAHLKRKGVDKMAGALAAVDFASEALKLSRSIDDTRGEAQALHAFAVSTIQSALLEPSMCFRTLSSDPTFEDGMDAARAALEMWKELGCTRSTAFEHQCIAQWELLCGQAEEAMENAQIALQDASKGHKAGAQGLVVQANLASGNGEQAVEVAKAAVQEAQNAGNKRNEVIAMDALMLAYKASGLIDEAWQTAEEVLECNRDLDDLVNEARTQSQIVSIHLERKDLDLALEAADECLRISTELEDKRAEAFARQKFADIHMFKGDSKKAMKEYKAMQKLFESIGDEKGQALALLDECNAHMLNEKYAEAINVANSAQDIYKTHGDKTGEGAALKLLSQLHQYLDDPEATLKAAARTKSLLRSIGDKRGEAQASMNVAHARLWALSFMEKDGLARDTSDFNEVWCRAEREARDGMSLAYTLQDVDLISTGHYMLAQVYVATDGHGSEALSEANQAVEMFKKAGDTRGEAISQAILGHAQFLCNDTEKAMEAMQEAFSIFQQMEDEGGQQMALRAMQSFMGAGMTASMPAMDFKVSAPTGGAAQVHQAPPGQVAAAAAPAVSLDTVTQQITKLVMDITQLDEDLPADLPLMQAGLTSNATVVLRNQLSETFPGVHIPFTLAFDYPSVSAVAGFMVENL